MIEKSKLYAGRKYVFKCDRFKVCGIFIAREDENIEIAKATVYLTQNENVDYIYHDTLIINEDIIREINVYIHSPKERMKENDETDDY